MEFSKSILTLNSKWKFGYPEDHHQVYKVLELAELSQVILLTVTVYYSKKNRYRKKVVKESCKEGRVQESKKNSLICLNEQKA